MKFILIFCIFTIYIKQNEGGGHFETFKKSSLKFALDLYKNLPNDVENKLVSPMSVQSILALLQAGSINKCLSELANILYLPKKPNDVSKLYKHSLALLSKDTNINMNIANAIFIKNDTPLPVNYINIAKLFDADIQKIDFSKTKSALYEINKWVNNSTNNKINNFIQNIEKNTDLLLLNAIYFNANWEIPFDAQVTMKRKFHVNENKIFDTDMMFQISEYLYKEDKILDAKILELPYQGGELAMTIVLPNTKTGLFSLYKRKLDNIFKENGFRKVEVSVLLPKFVMENKIELVEVLRKMGLNSIFDKLELEGIDSNDVLKVSQVLQKAFLNVNEIGSEGAAVSGIEIEDKIGGFNRKSFFADHPFLFFIRHKSSGNILFLGKYVKP